ncbi:hypothetical protein RIR_jg23698.t1 [Rhizophagus irregularis DAOM 181602=DAOM 197198]|nr:hypothetical protein RIR_jg23698.t1 [Rhizophagus irregularis DAOM 181602=DAOM 197198]
MIRTSSFENYELPYCGDIVPETYSNSYKQGDDPVGGSGSFIYYDSVDADRNYSENGVLFICSHYRRYRRDLYENF